jgi:hypothetical protein
MTPEREWDEILRRAMHSAVDSIEPSGDGLQRIRQRLEKPRWQVQLHLWVAECAGVVRLICVRLAPAVSAVSAAVLTARSALRTWLRWPREGAPADGDPAGHRGTAHHSQPPGRLAGLLGRLRPALAVAAAVVVVVAGVFALFQLRQGVTSIDLLGGRGQSPSAGSPAGTASTGHSVIPGVAPSPSGVAPRPSPRATGARHHASPAPTCPPNASSQPPQGASSSPPVSPSPAGSATDTPSPGGSTDPSPAATATSSPAVTSGPPVALISPASGPAPVTSGCPGTGTAAGSGAGSPVP